MYKHMHTHMRCIHCISNKFVSWMSLHAAIGYNKIVPLAGWMGLSLILLIHPHNMFGIMMQGRSPKLWYTLGWIWVFTMAPAQHLDKQWLIWCLWLVMIQWYQAQKRNDPPRCTSATTTTWNELISMFTGTAAHSHNMNGWFFASKDLRNPWTLKKGARGVDNSHCLIFLNGCF